MKITLRLLALVLLLACGSRLVGATGACGQLPTVNLEQVQKHVAHLRNIQRNHTGMCYALWAGLGISAVLGAGAWYYYARAQGTMTNQDTFSPSMGEQELSEFKQQLLTDYLRKLQRGIFARTYDLCKENAVQVIVLSAVLAPLRWCKIGAAHIEERLIDWWQGPRASQQNKSLQSISDMMPILRISIEQVKQADDNKIDHNYHVKCLTERYAQFIEQVEWLLALSIVATSSVAHHEWVLNPSNGICQSIQHFSGALQLLIDSSSTTTSSTVIDALVDVQEKLVLLLEPTIVQGA